METVLLILQRELGTHSGTVAVARIISVSLHHCTHAAGHTVTRCTDGHTPLQTPLLSDAASAHFYLHNPTLAPWLHTNPNLYPLSAPRAQSQGPTEGPNMSPPLCSSTPTWGPPVLAHTCCGDRASGCASPPWLCAPFQGGGQSRGPGLGFPFPFPYLFNTLTFFIPFPSGRFAVSPAVRERGGGSGGEEGGVERGRRWQKWERELSAVPAVVPGWRW